MTDPIQPVNPKPPVSKEMLDQMKRERQERGYPMSDSGGNYPPNQGSPKNNSNLKQYGIMAIISLVACFLLAYFGYLPNIVKVSEYNSKITAFQGTIDSLNANFKTLSDSIATAIDTKITTANAPNLTKITNMQAQVDNMAGVVKGLSDRIDQAKSQAEISYANSTDFTNKINNLSSQVTELNTKITNLQTTLATYTPLTSYNELASKVSALETKVNAYITPIATNVPSGVTLKLTQLSDSLLPTDDPATTGSTATSLLQASFKIVLTNTTTVDKEDVIIGLQVQTETIPNISGVSLTSSPSLSWIGSGWYSYSSEYRNSWGLTLEAGKSKTIYITLNIRGRDTTPYTNTYGYQVDAEVSY